MTHCAAYFKSMTLKDFQTGLATQLKILQRHMSHRAEIKIE